MRSQSSFFRFVSAVCCGTLGALSLQPGVVRSASPDRAAGFAASVRALQDAENTAPRDHWDPKYVESQLGNDPQRTFAWVRDHTYWIPYHGVLRGPVGVLMDRQGDSLDRALLLATMLKDEQQTVRLAHGTMAAPEVSALLSQLSVRRLAAAGLPSPRIRAESMAAVAGRYGLDAAAVASTLRAGADTNARRRRTLEATFKDQAARVAALAPGTGDGGAKANLDRASSALADHWWVQTRSGNTWRDWDVLGPGGAARATADRTSEVGGLPADLYHQVAIRVVIERWQTGAVSEKVALEHTIRTADVIGTSISLAFVADEFPASFPAPGASAGDALRRAAVDQHEWTPVLYVGSTHIIQNAITDSGGITMPSGQTDVLAVARGATHGLGAAIDETFSAAPAPPPANTPAGSYLTAAWLEYQIDSPGDPSQTMRREVFDVRGPAARALKSASAPTIDDAAKLSRGLALMMTTDILPVSCEFSSQFITHLAAQNVLQNRQAITDAVTGEVQDDFAGAKSLGGRLKVSGGSLYGLAYTRMNQSPLGALVFVDRPNLLTRHLFFVASGPSLMPVGATDIVANGVGVDLLGPPPYAARVAQGVFDTNAEALATDDSAISGSMTAAFAGAKQWVTIASPSDPALARLDLSPDARQRLTTALASNRVVIVPATADARSEFGGWWEVNPSTGETLGIGAHGWGLGPMSEFAVLLYAGALTFLSNWIFCAAGPGSGALPMANDMRPAAPLASALVDAIEVPLEARSTGCLNQALVSGLLGISLSALGNAAGMGGAMGRGGALPEEPMGTSGSGPGEGGPGGGANGGPTGSGAGSAGGGAGGSGGGGAGGAGGGAGGLSPGGGVPENPGVDPAWHARQARLADLGHEAFEAEHSGNKALAQNLRWQLAGQIDDDIQRAGGQPYVQQLLLDRGYGPVGNVGSPMATTGGVSPAEAQTLPAGGSFTPPGGGAGTQPFGGAPTMSGDGSVTQPLGTTPANSNPPCTSPCASTVSPGSGGGSTAAMVGLGGAMNALGGS